jgi:predicted Rossmann fold flavoprotein
MKKVMSEQFDVLVIGGGPAGLMAAGRAAEKGARVALVEKNDRYGIKLLMTGNGRCNVTQESDDMLELAKAYKNGRFLLSAFNMFGPSRMMGFLKSHGLETKIEKNGRVFPVSDQSKDVLEIMYQYCRNNMVTFFNTEEVKDIVANGNSIEKIITKKKEISAEKYILATGGKSYPQTGSSGQGYDWAEKMGHKIVEPEAVLVPIKTRETWVEELQGVGAGSVEISAWQGGKKKFSDIGDVMFAHYGLSGPLVLNMSRKIAQLNAQGEVKLKIDFKPYLKPEKLDEIIRADFERNASKQLVNCLQDLFSPKLLDFLLKRSGLDLKKHASSISKKERQKLVDLFKSLEMTVDSLFGFEKAMVTSGGVATKEIDSKTMKSKIIDNLYFAGEIIDVDGPTGGYNLQICWSTGYLAGESAASE